MLAISSSSLVDDSDDDALIKKLATLTDPTNGEARITMSAGETYDFTGPYHYDIQVVKADGTVITLMVDKIKFIKDITRRTT